MTDEQLHLFQTWFSKHVQTFREPNPSHQRNLDLKEEHTALVRTTIDRIATELGLSENACRIAAATALFHDLGRFPQYQKYRTFRDPDSDNHAKLSLRELNHHRVLHSLDRAERQLISLAIIFHNRRSLPSNLDPVALLHCRLIRDADKIDILRVMVEHFQLPECLQNPVITLGLDPKGGVRDPVYRQLISQKMIMNYSALETVNEMKVLLMSWVLDINFRPTFEILLEKNYIDSLAATLPDTPLLRQALASVKKRIERGLRLAP